MEHIANISDSDTLCTECKNIKYTKPLGKTSVVIVFHNEASCTLYRTIYSILETTPGISDHEVQPSHFHLSPSVGRNHPRR